VASSTGDPNPNRNAGGDFYWLVNDYNVEVRPGTFRLYEGRQFGHNIIAKDFGYVEDTELKGAPSTEGPTGFPSSALSCSSCHDPHGKIVRTGTTYLPIVVSGSYGGNDSRGNPVEAFPGSGVMGNYRLLGSTGYSPNGHPGSFSAPAPIAYATNDYSYYGSKVDYGSGMSEWCANCHRGFDQVSSQTTQHLHPANSAAALNGQATNYNRYVATGDLRGDQGTSYLGLVPFERGVTFNPDGYIGLLDPESTEGPSSSSNVMCLTCHRAHANGFRNAGRWDFETELLVESNPSPVSSGDYPYGVQEGYYYGGERIDIVTKFNAGQRSLCNKCHIQD